MVVLITGVATRLPGGIVDVAGLYAANRDARELHGAAPFRRFDPELTHMAQTGE